MVVVRVVGEGGHLWIAMVLGEGCGMGEGRETGASLFGVEEEVNCIEEEDRQSVCSA